MTQPERGVRRMVSQAFINGVEDYIFDGLLDECADIQGLADEWGRYGFSEDAALEWMDAMCPCPKLARDLRDCSITPKQCEKPIRLAWRDIPMPIGFWYYVGELSSSACKEYADDFYPKGYSVPECVRTQTRQPERGVK